MTQAPARYLAAWGLLTLLGCAAVFAQSRLALAPLPDVARSRWAADQLRAAVQGLPLTASVPTRDAHTSVIVISAYDAGKRLARHVASGTLEAVTAQAAASFAKHEVLRAFAKSRVGLKRLRFRIEVARGGAPVLALLPWLRPLALVPLREGVCARLATRTACLTPDDILALGLYDRAVTPPIPDLTFGTDLTRLESRLADELEVALPELYARGRIERVRFAALEPWASPDDTTHPTREQLELAAREGAEFLLRHQRPSGRYTYVYDAREGRAAPRAGYNVPRHAGVSYFLAQAAHALEHDAARDGALRALDYLEKNDLESCGDAARACVLQGDDVDLGATALAALAAAELLDVTTDEAHAHVAQLLARLTAFLRAQQRPDGELMHEYDRKRGKPIDVQHMYYSGEAALALLSAYEHTRDARDLESAKRLMKHLTGAGWSFFGSRYFYGEEHWTCQAVGKAAAHMDVSGALDFCLRWARWQGKLQYRTGQTPWDVTGALGVGPVLLPRTTMPASRIEAMVPIYRVFARRDRHGEEARELRALIEPSIGFLLRSRWAPGPAHLFRDPARARGGMPSTAAELSSRIDVVQHAGSAWLAWADSGVFDPP